MVGLWCCWGLLLPKPESFSVNFYGTGDKEEKNERKRERAVRKGGQERKIKVIF